MDIPKGEVLRYLGHRGQAISPELDGLIDGAIADCRRLARPRWIHLLLEPEWEGETLRLLPSGILLPGADIRAHLDGARGVALLAVTLGVEVDTEIRILQRADMPRCLALDAAASACAESACEQAAGDVCRQAAGLGLYPGPRYSPGYGDLPLSLQPELLRLLDAGRRIGLTCSDSHILLPRKSVTALIGLFASPRSGEGSACERCPRAGECAFRAISIGGYQDEKGN